MAKKSAFRVSIVGEIDQPILDDLRDRLALTRAGRLTDDWDSMFGYRHLKGVGTTAVDLRLYRPDGHPWYVTVSHPTDEVPSGEEIAQWRREIIEGIKAAGLTPDPTS
jgi:hypothetical protein